MVAVSHSMSTNTDTEQGGSDGRWLRVSSTQDKDLRLEPATHSLLPVTPGPGGSKAFGLHGHLHSCAHILTQTPIDL